MISALEIRNFKCFDHLRLSFSRLTLLTGFNGGGKSSAIQPLLLLGQGLRESPQPQAFALNGPLVHLGTVADVLPVHAGESNIEFTVFGPRAEAAWTLGTRAGDRFLRVAGSGENGSVDQGQSPLVGAAGESGSRIVAALATLTYLSAVREGTADAYPIPDSVGEAFGDVGVDGRFAAYWYDKFVDNEVPAALCHPSEPATSLRKQLDAWIGTLFPGAQANVQMIPSVSLLSLQFRLSEIGAWIRPSNIGYGLTYAFPILVALLTSRQPQILVVDSPEAHLHPSAQSQIGRLLAFFAAAGVQVIVESHSDHLLNGARLAVKEGILSRSDLQIHFFKGPTKEGHGVISPSLDSEGRIDEWPDGFFDQSEKDLSRLAGWA